MEGCTAFESDKKCKICKKGCPDDNSHNWRYFNLTDEITVTGTSDRYKFCVEGCVKFKPNSTDCEKCAKYSDSASAGLEAKYDI